MLRSSYELTDQEVFRNRVLVAEQGLIGIRRQSRREEEARDPLLGLVLRRDVAQLDIGCEVADQVDAVHEAKVDGDQSRKSQALRTEHENLQVDSVRPWASSLR